MSNEKTEREADKAHRKKIEKEVFDAMSGLPNDTPSGCWDCYAVSRIIKAIVAGKIPHCKIEY